METEKLIKAYIRIRDARAQLKSEYNDKDSELLSKMESIEEILLEHAKENNIDSMKTASGTAYRQVKTRYWAPDWDSFKKFVQENDGIDLLEQRIHQTNFKQFLEDNPDVIPPVNSDSRYSIVIRRGK